MKFTRKRGKMITQFTKKFLFSHDKLNNKKTSVGLMLWFQIFEWPYRVTHKGWDCRDDWTDFFSVFFYIICFLKRQTYFFNFQIHEFIISGTICAQKLKFTLQNAIILPSLKNPVSHLSHQFYTFFASLLSFIRNNFLFCFKLFNDTCLMVSIPHVDEFFKLKITFFSSFYLKGKNIIFYFIIL